MDLQALSSQFFPFCTCNVSSIAEIKESTEITLSY